MSSERIEERLDAMLAPLRNCTAQLNEIAQARVQARLEAALAKTADAAEPRTARGWRRAGVAAVLGVAAAAGFAVAAVVSRGAPGAGEIAATHAPAPAGSSAKAVGAAALAGSAADIAGGSVATGSAGTAAGVANAPGAALGAERPSQMATSAEAVAADATAHITVADGESAQLTLDGAAVTIYGPGRLSPTPGGAVVEAAGLVVDRTRGDKPWSVRYHGVKVVAINATFALDHGTNARVTVMRGEVVLRCPSGPRTVRSGTSGTCEPAVRPNITPTSQVHASLPEEPQVLAPRLRPDPITGDPYSAAESALRRGDYDTARDALLAIVDATPDSLDAATALFDLARLAVTRGDTSGALGYLDRLDHHPRRAAFTVAAAQLRGTLPQSPITDLPPAP